LMLSNQRLTPEGSRSLAGSWRLQNFVLNSQSVYSD
jgi:hypothetical protein